MLEINGLSKMYGEFTVLEDVTMSVQKGSIYAFLGENGAGKTTTLRIIMGLLSADKGEIYIQGQRIKLMSKKEKSCIGYMPDFFGIYDNLKVIEYMEFYASLYGIVGKTSKKVCNEILEKVQLDEFQNQYVDKLSKGMKQKLGLARTLIHNPQLLILDEPTNGLDTRSRIDMDIILQELNRDGKTILISSNILSDLTRISTHIGILHNGKIKMEGYLKDILASKEFHGNLMIEILDNMEKAVLILKKSKLVKNIIIQENVVSIAFLGSELEEAKLLQEMAIEEVMIRSFKRDESDIEQIFMRLTERN